MSGKGGDGLRIYFTFSPDGYVNGYWSIPSGIEGELSVDVDNDAEVLQVPEVFQYVNGELVKDEAYQQELIEQEEQRKNQPSDEEMNAMAIMDLASKILGGGE